MKQCRKGRLNVFIPAMTYLKLLLVIQRRGHTTKYSTPGDAMMGDTNCLSEGKVDACEILRYAVQPTTVIVDGLLVASSRLCPGRSDVVSALHFRVAYAATDRTSAIGAASRRLRRVLFGLLSNSAVSYMMIPFDIIESAQAAHVEGIQSIVITDGHVPCLRSI